MGYSTSFDAYKGAYLNKVKEYLEMGVLSFSTKSWSSRIVIFDER